MFKPADKKPKKNPWSDEEAESDEVMEIEEPAAPRERVERVTKGNSYITGLSKNLYYTELLTSRLFWGSRIPAASFTR